MLEQRAVGTLSTATKLESDGKEHPMSDMTVVALVNAAVETVPTESAMSPFSKMHDDMTVLDINPETPEASRDVASLQKYLRHKSHTCDKWCGEDGHSQYTCAIFAFLIVILHILLPSLYRFSSLDITSCVMSFVSLSSSLPAI